MVTLLSFPLHLTCKAKSIKSLHNKVQGFFCVCFFASPSVSLFVSLLLSLRRRSSAVGLYNFFCIILLREENVSVTSKRLKAFGVGYSTLTVHFLSTALEQQKESGELFTTTKNFIISLTLLND